MKRVIWVIAVVVFVALVAWFAIHNRGGGGNGFGRNQGPPDVTTIVATVGEIPLDVKLPGRTTAYRIAEIRPQVSGIIQKRLFTEGADVDAGAHLYQLDPSIFEAAVASARANVAQARAGEHSAQLKFNRYKNLLAKKSASQQDYDDAEAALQQAKAQVAVAQAAVRTAELNLGYTHVYAPIAGHIGKSFVTEGALVTANQSQALAVITQLDPIYVDIQQSSAENMKLRKRLNGQAVPVTIVPSGDDKPFGQTGRLEFSEVTVDESTGSVGLRVVVPNPDHILLPGMFVNATLHLGTVKAIALPQQVVTRNPDGDAVVWVVSGDDTVRAQVVETERTYRDEWVITSGLKQGDVVVYEGMQRLSPGIKVVPQPWTPAETKP